MLDFNEIASQQKYTLEDTAFVDALNKKALSIRKSYPNKSLDLALKAREVAIEINYSSGLAYSYLASGSSYSLLSQFQIALVDLQKAQSVFEFLHDFTGLSSVIRAIGNIHNALFQYEKALEVYFDALKYSREANDKSGIAYIYRNLSSVYHFQEKYAVSLEYASKSMELFIEEQDELGLTDALNSVGNTYLKTNQTQKAFEVLNRSLKISDFNNHLKGIAQANTSLGKYYCVVQNFKSAVLHHQQAMSAAKEMGEKMLISEIYKNLADTYKLIGDYEQALQCFEFHDQVKSKVLTANNEVIINVMHTQYELEQAEKEKEIYKLRNFELAKANRLIETKNKDITDSIKYAKHIQEASLPDKTEMDANLKDYFVLYKPKDIVSGDFYWFAEKDGLVYLAAVDCTGHGVPGAFISIVGQNLLRQALSEGKSKTAAQMLDEVNRLFNLTIRQTFEESTVRDGMDISLCIIDFSTLKLQFAGAFNPLFLVRETSLTKYTADKFPIGIFIGEEVRKFKNNEIDLQPNDVIYMASDGYADQFGGEDGKKLKNKFFHQILVENHLLEMYQQKVNLENFHNQWRGDYDQVDDILVIGIRI
jgi:serine phosphatase RsbU (regulator of sigma subunit)